MKMVLQQCRVHLAEERSEEISNCKGIAASRATHKSSFMKRRGIIITGATGSGKSKCALEIADDIKSAGQSCVIINCDAMQIYKELPIITAQPDAADTAKTEHLLYGFRSIYEKEKYSVGKYLQDLRATIDAFDRECIPIVVGGSMMYVEAIIDGIDKIPEIDAARLVEIRHFFEKKSTQELFQILVKKDKKYADFLLGKDSSTNRQKIMRALEVVSATGKSIMDFWGNKRKLFNDFQFEKYITNLDRERLYEKINKRFDKMLLEGALEEVKTVHEKAKKNNYEEVKKTLPKVIGLRELFDYFDGLITLDTAIEEAKQASRRYAKRQLTWFRNRFISFETI